MLYSPKRPILVIAWVKASQREKKDTMLDMSELTQTLKMSSLALLVDIEKGKMMWEST